MELRTGVSWKDIPFGSRYQIPMAANSEKGRSVNQMFLKMKFDEPSGK